MGLTALDILVLLAVGGAAILGFMRGFVTEVLSLMAWIFVIFALKLFHTPLSVVKCSLAFLMGWWIVTDEVIWLPLISGRARRAGGVPPFRTLSANRPISLGAHPCSWP